ncbi:MAG: peptide-methionine (R)-S-oxide reductase MsrB [Alphaproteobacteria bacterium]
MSTGTATKPARSAAGFDLAPPSAAQLDALTAELDPEERRVLLDHGTERPFCGTLLDNKQAGTYLCRVCGLPLFGSQAKFESGTGWPSFFAPYDRHHVAMLRDRTYGMERTEIRCARCDGHLGHVFPDGPPPSGARYCLNSASMTFLPAGETLPDKLGRGDPRTT